MLEPLAGRSWVYGYRELYRLFDDEKKAIKSTNSISQQFSKLTANWNDDINSEWISRNYLSIKMIMQATLQIASLEHAKDVNLRPVESYLKYYAMLTSMRALYFMLPTTPWNNGKMITAGHSTVINSTCDFLKKFNEEKAKEFSQKTFYLKASRELISYRAPSSGDSGIHESFYVNNICRIFIELAQFCSEILEQSYQKKHQDDKFLFNDEYLEQLCLIEIDGFQFFDSEDCYRLGYRQRKFSYPANLWHSMPEGHTEDFFGAWDPTGDFDEIPEGVFSMGSPCEWQELFYIP